MVLCTDLVMLNSAEGKFNVHLSISLSNCIARMNVLNNFVHCYHYQRDGSEQQDMLELPAQNMETGAWEGWGLRVGGILVPYDRVHPPKQPFFSGEQISVAWR